MREWFAENEMHLLRRIRRSRFSPVLSYVVSRICSAKNFNPNQSVLLAGTGRSGTTWISETVCAHDNFLMVREPFHSPQIDIDVNQYISPKSKKERYLKSHLRSLFEGSDLHTNNISSKFRLSKLAKVKRTFVKSIHGSRVLPWIEENFDLKTIMLIRHPCAVVSSQLRFKGGWGQHLREKVESGKIKKQISKALEKEKYGKLPVDLLKELNEKIDNLSKKLTDFTHFLAFKWIGDILVPLRNPSPQRCVFTYEEFVREGEKSLQKLFEHINENVSNETYKRFSKPSSTAQKRSNVLNDGDPLKTWRMHLSDAQVSKILNMVRSSGIDLYDYGVTPKFKSDKFTEKVKYR